MDKPKTEQQKINEADLEEDFNAENTLNLEVLSILLDNKLVDRNIRLANKAISKMFITSIPLAPILEKYKQNQRLLCHIFMNAIILPIVKDQENLFIQGNENKIKMNTTLEFSHNTQKLTMNISCYYSEDRRKIITYLKIDYINNKEPAENIVRNTQDFAKYNNKFVFSQYPLILIDQETSFSKIMHNISHKSKPIIENFINALFTANIENKPKVQITTNPLLSDQFTNYIRHVKFSSTGGITKELWEIINVNPQGGAPKQTKYKKTNQIIAYKNKSYCLYTGIKGGNYIRVKHNGTLIFKYIKPT
jgi:hypothetical protein